MVLTSQLPASVLGVASVVSRTSLAELDFQHSNTMISCFMGLDDDVVA